MATIGQVRQLASFAATLHATRAVTAFQGHLRQDPMALLMLGPARRNPCPIYERIRAEGPLVRTRLGNWVATSHPVCNRVLRDRHFGVLSGGAEGGLGLSFLEMNPPDHTRLRRLVAPAFAPRRMAGYAARIEQTVHRLLDDVPAHGRFDLVSAFAAPLPIAVITELLGLPDAHVGEFARWGAVIGSALDGVSSLRHARQVMAAQAAMEAMFVELFERRRREPADDLVSAIVAAEGSADAPAGEKQVSPAEMVPLCTLLLIAGFETTVNLIANGVLALIEHPEQWRQLCADPALAANAVEEILRYDPPVQRTGRVALARTDIDGTVIRRGEFVVTLIGAANRDPDVYADPSRFDITRQLPVEHLAFSSGIHYCLGQPLARLEARIALAALAERLPGLRRAGRVVHRDAATIRGPLRLPVAV